MQRTMLCVAIVAMVCVVGAAYAQDGDSWTDRISVSGYTHARYDTGDSVEDGFNFRRMFLNVISRVNDRTMGVITLSRAGGTATDVDLYNAFVDYKINEQWNVQVGQVPTWFGLEGWEGSSARGRLVLERAAIIEGGPQGTQGFYFKGAPDRGVWFRRNPVTAQEPLVVLGVCNGEFRAGDVNTAKDVSVDLKWQREWGLFGMSWLNGTMGDTAAGEENPREAFGAYARLFPAPWGLQAEWAGGEMMGDDRDGWYVQGMHAFEDHPGILFARWEQMSIEAGGTTTAQLPGSNSDYDALIVGYEYKLDDNNEITAQWTDAEWTARAAGVSTTSDASWGAVQWQYAFK